MAIRQTFWVLWHGPVLGTVPLSLQDKICGRQRQISSQKNAKIRNPVAGCIGKDQRIQPAGLLDQLTCNVGKAGHETEGIIGQSTRLGVNGGQVDLVFPDVEISDQIVSPRFTSESAAKPEEMPESWL